MTQIAHTWIIAILVYIVCYFPNLACAWPPVSSAPVATQPEDDPDNDFLTNQGEADANTKPKIPDSDGDGVEDGKDSVPTNSAMKAPVAPEVRYAFIDLGSEYAPTGLNDYGDVLLVKPGLSNGVEVGAVWTSGGLTILGDGQEGSFRGPLLDRSVLFGTPATTTSPTRTVSYNKRWMPGPPAVVSDFGLYSDRISSSAPFGIPLPANLPSNGIMPETLIAAQASKWAGLRNSMNADFASYVPPFHPYEGEGAWNNQLTGASLLWTNDNADYSFAGSTWIIQSATNSIAYRLMEARSVYEGHQTLMNNSSNFVIDVTSDGVPAIPSRPSGFRSNTQGLILSTFEDQPAITNWVNGEPVNQMFPDARAIEDITPTDPTYGTHFVGYTPAWGTAIWHYSSGNFTQQLIEGFFPWYPASTKVTSRRISNSIVIPMGDGIWRNGRTQRIPALLGDQPAEYKDWNIFQVSPNKNFLLATATKVSGKSQRALLMIPADITVDANRDGVVRYGGSTADTAGVAIDKTSKQKPFRFWCNDDNDGTEDGVENGASGGFLYEDIIKSKRDLEDFTRLYLSIGAFSNELGNGTVKVGLKWRNTSGTSPKIKVYRSADPEGSTAYLETDAAATAQLTGVFRTTLGEVSGSTPLILPADVWTGHSQSNSRKSFIFESTGEGEGELCITIHNSDGVSIGEGPGVWLDLLNVKEMYQRGKAEPENIPAPQESLSGPFNGPVEAIQDDAIPFEAEPNEEKKAMIFVHGWSMDYPSYLSFSETMFKRMWHQGFKGRFCAFRWDPLVAGETYAGEYNRSEHRAFVYGDALKQFAEALKGEGFGVSLAGHSMGNIVCSSALQKGLMVQNYLLLEAAVPAGCYDESGGDAIGGVNGYDPFWRKEDPEPTPDYHQAPNGDLTKGYRGFFKGIGNNANRVVNFHNALDFALATGSTAGFETNWEKNQIDFKPDGNGATVWRYFYFPDRALNERARLRVNLLNGRDVTDSYEMKAFVARPRSKAVGAVDASLGNLPTGMEHVNLGAAPYNFDDREGDHSGQFNRRIQEVSVLYLRIKEIVQPTSVP